MSQIRSTMPQNSTNRKTGGLWSYILPPTTSASSSPPDPDAAGQIPPSSSVSLPATGPSDRSAVSVRLMLGDAKAALQQLSDRVERVVDETGNARREVTEAGRGVEEAYSGMIKQVQVIVKQAIASVQEANAAHTSSLEAASTQIANLETALATQATTVSDLARTCAINQSLHDTDGHETQNIANLLDRTAQVHSALLSLSPVIPLLQAIPAEVSNAQLMTTGAIERLQAETLRVARDARLEIATLSEEKTRAALSAMSDLSAARDQMWREQLDATAGNVKKELEKCREDWVSALSMHRQEVSGLLSVRLASCMHGSAHTAMDAMQKGSGITTNVEAPPNLLSHSLRGGKQPSRHPSLRTSPQAARPPNMDTTSTMIQRASSEMVEDVLGVGNSLFGASSVAAKTADRRRVDVGGGMRSDQDRNKIQGPAVPKSSNGHVQALVTEPRLEPSLDLEDETQSTALTSLPDVDEDARDLEDSQVQTETQENSTPGGRLFGALNQPSRTRSARQDFTTPESPPFSVRPQPLSIGKGSNSRTLTAQQRPLFPCVLHPQPPATQPVSNPTTVKSPLPGSTGDTAVSTLGYSSPSSTLRSNAGHSPTSVLQKRVSTSLRQGVIKRPKTRKLMTAE
ncbi:hypothetical protein FRC07_011590, partial [Ceratobasidium sp. 392]